MAAIGRPNLRFQAEALIAEPKSKALVFTEKRMLGIKNCLLDKKFFTNYCWNNGNSTVYCKVLGVSLISLLPVY